MDEEPRRPATCASRSRQAGEGSSTSTSRHSRRRQASSSADASRAARPRHCVRRHSVRFITYSASSSRLPMVRPPAPPGGGADGGLPPQSRASTLTSQSRGAGVLPSPRAAVLLGRRCERRARALTSPSTAFSSPTGRRNSQKDQGNSGTRPGGKSLFFMSRVKSGQVMVAGARKRWLHVAIIRTWRPLACGR